MTLTVFILILISSAMHVGWNACAKTCRDKVSFAWTTCVAGTLVLVPVFVVSRLVSGGVLNGEVIAWAALSGLCEAAYYVPLFVAYDRVDLSVAYPLSRGVAPLVTLALGGVLLGDVMTLLQGFAVVIVGLGAGAVSWSAWASAPHRRTVSGIGLALWSACFIAGYHLVDRRVMTLQNTPNPLEFLFLLHCFLTVYVGIWMVASRSRRARANAEWRTNKRGVLFVGVGSVFAYWLILLALRSGNVTSITAGRNIGIAISALVGSLFLGEPVSWKRAVGAGLVTLGVIALVLLGS